MGQSQSEEADETLEHSEKPPGSCYLFAQCQGTSGTDTGGAPVSTQTSIQNETEHSRGLSRLITITTAPGSISDFDDMINPDDVLKKCKDYHVKMTKWLEEHTNQGDTLHVMPSLADENDENNQYNIEELEFRVIIFEQTLAKLEKAAKDENEEWKQLATRCDVLYGEADNFYQSITRRHRLVKTSSMRTQKLVMNAAASGVGTPGTFIKITQTDIGSIAEGDPMLPTPVFDDDSDEESDESDSDIAPSFNAAESKPSKYEAGEFVGSSMGAVGLEGLPGKSLVEILEPDGRVKDNLETTLRHATATQLIEIAKHDPHLAKLFEEVSSALHPKKPGLQRVPSGGSIKILDARLSDLADRKVNDLGIALKNDSNGGGADFSTDGLYNADMGKGGEYMENEPSMTPPHYMRTENTVRSESFADGESIGGGVADDRSLPDNHMGTRGKKEPMNDFTAKEVQKPAASVRTLPRRYPGKELPSSATHPMSELKVSSREERSEAVDASLNTTPKNSASHRAEGSPDKKNLFAAINQREKTPAIKGSSVASEKGTSIKKSENSNNIESKGSPDKSNLFAAIRGGNKTLKKAAPKQTDGAPDKSNLFASIRGGKNNLKKAAPKDPNAAPDKSNLFAAIRVGKNNLKKAAPKDTNAAPDKSNLFAAIRGGKNNLKKAAPKEDNGAPNKSNLFAAIRGGKKNLRKAAPKEDKGAPDKSNLFASIRGGRKNLKKTAPAKKSGGAPDKSNLFASIRSGKKNLRTASASEKKTGGAPDKGNLFAAIRGGKANLRRASAPKKKTGGAPDKSNLFAAIRGGKANLRRASAPEKKTGGAPDKGNLFASIRGGKKQLRRVERKQKEKPKKKLDPLAAALARRRAKQKH